VLPSFQTNNDSHCFIAIDNRAFPQQDVVQDQHISNINNIHHQADRVHHHMVSMVHHHHPHNLQQQQHYPNYYHVLLVWVVPHQQV
jgi:hypothetical protein